MPLADKSIIAPGEVKSRAPLKKSTVAWLVAGIAGLALVGVAAPRAFSDSPSEPKAPQQPQAQTQGQAKTIDAELEQAQRRAQEEQRRAMQVPTAVVASTGHASSQGPLPDVAPLPGSPVPDSARRVDNTAAVYARKFDPAAGADTDTAVEIEAAARKSKSVQFDQSEATVGAAARSAIDSASDVPSSTPSASGAGVSVQDQKIDENRAAIQALVGGGRGASGGGTGGAAADRAWLTEFGSSSNRAKPIRPYQIGSKYTLVQGKVIPAVLGRDLNTDLPGEVTACTTMDVYDSISSDYLLIPKGSCLAGQYSNGIRAGQERVLFAFSRIVMPDGTSLDLPANPGSDVGGAAGVAGEVNNHFFRMFSSSLLVALLADRVERNTPAPSTSVGAAAGARTAAGQVLVDTSRTILDRNRVIPPTITVAKGTRINVEVTRDMEFPGPYRGRK